MEVAKVELDQVLLWEPKMNGLKSLPIWEFTEDTVQLRERLFSTCIRYDGVGLAASQIGVYLRAAIINFETTTRFLVNPEIVKREGEKSFTFEGCLSLPGASGSGQRVVNQGRVSRYDDITVAYHTETGEEKTERFMDVVAHVVAHEIQHLDGVFFIEHLRPLDREQVMRKFRNFKKHYAMKADEVEVAHA